MTNNDQWNDIFEAAAARLRTQRTAPRPRPVGFDTPNISSMAERAARDINERFGGWSIDGPMPVEELANNMGFQVVRTSSRLDGHLSNPDGGAILVRDDAPHNRARFTVAHELAHVWSLRFDDSEFVSRLSAKQTESFCDAVAGRLLVPSTALAQLPKQPDFASAFALAEKLEVSMPVVVIRANAAKLWRCLIVTWKPRETGWIASASAGGPWDARSWQLPASHLTHSVGPGWHQVSITAAGKGITARMQLGRWSRSAARTLVHSVNEV